MKRLTLTFDNGPTPGVTDAVLDILAAHDVRSTFFVIGSKIADSKAHRARMIRAHDAGHWIGNHTFRHAGLMSRQPDVEAQRGEIERTQALIGDLTHPDRLYRPCGGGGQLVAGLLTEAARRLLIEQRYSLVLWNAIPRDWDDPEGWPERALSQIETLANSDTDWPLMVLHDIEGGALARLDTFLSEVKRRGFRILQELPAASVPIRAGHVAGDVTAFVG